MDTKKKGFAVEIQKESSGVICYLIQCMCYIKHKTICMFVNGYCLKIMSPMQIGSPNLFMRGSRKFCQRGSNSDTIIFWLMRWDRIQIPLKASHHRPTSETPFKWSHGSLVILYGIRTSIAKKPYIFLVFQGVRTPSLWIRAFKTQMATLYFLLAFTFDFN